MESRINEIELSIKKYKNLALICIILALSVLVLFWILFYYSKGTEYDYLKDLGSISGGIVSSLFSLSGLILVYVAFLGQKQQIINQQIEININSQELILTRNEMKQQNETLKIQQFENTFFNLLSNYKKNISLFYINENRNSFKVFFRAFDNSMFEDNSYSIENANKILRSTKLTYKNSFDYTFLYQLKSIIQIINNSNIENPDYYIETLMDQLSLFEKRCIYIIVKYDTKLENDVNSVFIESRIFEKYNSNLVLLKY